jgi:hypothetical protein
MINIYDVNGKVLMQAEITSSAIRVEELSKSDYISLSWNSAEKVILPAGAYIVHKYKIDKVREVTRQFLLLESYEPTQSDEMSWKYTPEFQHQKMVLSKKPFFIRTRNSKNEVIKQYDFDFFGTMVTIADRLKDFLNNELKFGNAGWVINYDITNTNAINVSFSDNDFMSALTAITNAIGDNCEWHIDYDNETIHIGNVLRDDLPIVTLKVGENVGIPSITNSKEDYYNAFAVFGGTRNITQVNDKGENISSSDIKLQLSKGSGTTEIDGKKLSYSIDEFSTIDMRQNKNEQLFIKILNFAQIYPSLNTYVYNVRGREKYVLQDGNKIPLTYNADGSVKTYKTFTVWYVRMAYPTTEKIADKKLVNTTVDNGVTHYWYDFEVTDDLLINGKNIGCSFEANFNEGALSTPLAGRGTNGDYVGFELTYHKEASSTHTTDDVDSSNFAVLAGDFEIIYQEDNDLIIPTNAKDMIIPKGESLPSYKCNITVLYNIAMTESIYTEDAQKRLLDAAMKEIKRLLSDLNNYSVKSYPQVFEAKNPCLQIGQKVVYDDGNGYQLNTRAQKITTNIDFEFVQEITVGNEVIKGNTAQLKEDVKEIIASGGSGSGGGGNYTTSQLKNLIGKYGTGYFVSKLFDDTANGKITFIKGLVAKALADLAMGATFGNSAKITELGEAVFSAIKSLDYDNAAEQGFSVEKEKNGKYHAFFTNLTIWGKAIFHELEIRKLSYSGGNIYLSGAGSKLVRVVPVKKLVSDGGVTTWVKTTEDDVECVGWKCYLLADNGTTATMNYWQEGDQVRCQTIGEIAAGGTYSDVSNKSYWRTIPDGGVSTQNEKIYGTKLETYLDEDGNEQTKEVQVELYDGQAFAWIVIGKHCGDIDGYDDEFSVGYNGSNPAPLETRDIPSAGDTIVLDGNRHRNEHGEYDKTDRQNVIILETTGEYAPRIACYANISEYKHTITKSVNGSDKEVSLSVFETSPKGGTKINSSRFEWISDDGSTINIINYRGDWEENNTYHKNDQVNYNNAVWVCVANSGVDVADKPSEGSSNWKKVLSGGKGEKGDDAVSYSVSLMKELRTIAGHSNQSAVTVSFRKQEGSKSTVSGNIATFGDSASVKCYIDGERSDNMTDWINSGNDYFGYLNYEDAWTGKSVITVVMYIGDNIVASANFSLGQSGEGVVMAYKNATSRPSKPTVEDLSQLSDGWSRTPQKGGSYLKVDNISYGSFDNGASSFVDSTSKSWTDVTEGGNSWKKSPSGLSDNYGWAIMKVSFTTNVDNSDVKVTIKAYSEGNYDFVQVHALDTEITGSSSLRKTGVADISGNGIETSYSYHVTTTGQHFFYVSYCKDVSGNSNGDYGLFRFDLSDNLVTLPSTVWMSQATLKDGKAVLPWSEPVKITGEDAYRVVVSPSVLIFDTDDYGKVAESSLGDKKTATIRVYQGDKDVSKQFSKYDRLPSNYYNCNGSLKDLNTSPLEIQVTEIETQVVTDTEGNESTISKTNGFLEFILTNASATVTAHVDVQVNVAKFAGQMVNTNKRFSNTLTEVGNKVDNKMDSFDLNEFKAEITQTAREISLSVSEKAIGRRNLLIGSAARRQGEGWTFMSGDYYNNLPCESIEINSGHEGVNAIHCRTKQTGTNSYYMCGFRWVGTSSSQGNIKLKKGKSYTLSFWAKAYNSGYVKFISELIWQGSATDNSRPAGYTGPKGFLTTQQATKSNTWTQFKVNIEVPSSASYEYVEVNIFARATNYTLQDAYICKPMLEEGDYNGWTLSEQDYDYVGGNLLDNTRTLTVGGNLNDVSESTIISQGYGYDSAVAHADNSSGSSYKEILRWGTTSGGNVSFQKGKDYLLSFLANGSGRMTCYLYCSANNTSSIYSENNQGYVTNNAADGASNFTLSSGWKRYWVHFRVLTDSPLPTDILMRAVIGTNVYVAQPKLEEGATMTEYTERKSELVDKASLKAAGIVVDSESVTLYGNQVHIKKNKTDANDTVLIDNNTGTISAGLIKADEVVARGIKAQNLEATSLKVTGNSQLGIFEIRTAKKDDRDQYTIGGDAIQYSGGYMFPDGKTEAFDAGSFLMYKPMFVRQGSPDNSAYMRLGYQFTEWDDCNISGGNKNYFFVGAAARYVCSGDTGSCSRTLLPVDLKYSLSYSELKPAAYIYSVKTLQDDPAFAIKVVKPEGSSGERTAIQTNAAIRGVFAPNATDIYKDRQIPNGIGVVYCSNNSDMTLTLPVNPVDGQTLIIIQGSNGRVYIIPPSNDVKIYCGGYTRDRNNKFFSGMTGQFNIFVYASGAWQLQWMNYKP